MFNEYQLKYILESEVKINYETYYKSDLITMIKILKEENKKLKEKIKNEEAIKNINKNFKW